MSNESNKTSKKLLLKSQKKLLNKPSLILNLFKNQLRLADIKIDNLKTIKKLGKTALNDIATMNQTKKTYEITFIPTLYPEMRERYLRTRPKSTDENKSK